MTAFVKLTNIDISMESHYFTNSFFNEDDIKVNFEDFENGKQNFLLITGFSGSGKSTLAKNLATEYNAEYVEMDILNFKLVRREVTKEDIEEMRKSYPAIYKYIMTYHKSNPNWMFNYLTDPKISFNDKRTFRENESNKFIDWVINKYKKKVVIEGVSVAVYITMNNKTRKYPIIFKGTSKYNSILRMLKRDHLDNWEKIKDILLHLPELKMWYDMDEVSQNSARVTIL